MHRRKFLTGSAVALAVPSFARSEETPGVTAAEIKIGNTIPYSGPVSAASGVGRAQLAYIAMINDQGGVNGRKINLVSLDNEYSPPKALEQTRRLVEQDRVLAISGTLGTPTNAAIQKYLNQNGVPHLFVISGASRWNDPEHFPWTIGLVPATQHDARVFAKYLLTHKPHAKIAVLYQNDDLGKDGLKALRAALGIGVKAMLVADASHEVTDPTVDSQVVTLRTSGADTIIMFTTPRFATLALRKAYDIGWRPLRLLNTPSAESIPITLGPVGLDKCVGVIGSRFNKDPNDPQWKDDPGVREWITWMRNYLPGADTSDGFYITGYDAAQLLVRVLRQCGGDLTRANIMRQATNLDVELPMLLPGIRATTSLRDVEPIKQSRLVRFNGKSWEALGDSLSE